MDKILLFTPMYNCEKQIVRVMKQMTPEVGQYISEWIIVNNRSTDNSESVVKEYLQTNNIPMNVKVLRNDENYGLGGSHKVAFGYAMKNDFDYLIVLHGDDQGDISNILPYLKSEEYKDYDCFLGARFMKESKLQGYSKFRTFGNRVYDFLFSVGCGYKVYDLGSGLNMYKTSIFQDGFYLKYKDNLIFNYCMVMGSAYYKHKIKFFPIVWREDDQVSNVKMLNQAITVLELLGTFIIDKKKFVQGEHRDSIVKNYTAQVIYKKEVK